MTKHINYTSDRIINRDLNELDRIEALLKPYPDKVDYNNINLAHVMLKEEQKRLQQSAANFTDRQKSRLQSSSAQQPLRDQKSLQHSQYSANNASMQQTNSNSEQSPTASLMAQNSVQNDRPRIHPSRFELSKNLDDFIRKEEGYKSALYEGTAKNPTIGIGHKVVKGEYKVGDTITKEQAEKHFAEDKETARQYALKLVGHLPMHRYEFEAIVDAMFNVGPGNLGLGTDKSPHLNKAIKAGNYTGEEGISSNLIYSKDSKGDRQGGLIKRSSGRTNMFNGKFGEY